jgi:hypothetical protein
VVTGAVVLTVAGTVAAGTVVIAVLVVATVLVPQGTPSPSGSSPWTSPLPKALQVSKQVRASGSPQSYVSTSQIQVGTSSPRGAAVVGAAVGDGVPGITVAEVVATGAGAVVAVSASPVPGAVTGTRWEGVASASSRSLPEPAEGSPKV